MKTRYFVSVDLYNNKYHYYWVNKDGVVLYKDNTGYIMVSDIYQTAQQLEKDKNFQEVMKEELALMI